MRRISLSVTISLLLLFHRLLENIQDFLNYFIPVKCAFPNFQHKSTESSLDFVV